MKKLFLFFAVLLTACSTMENYPSDTIRYIPTYGIDYWRYYPSYPWYYEPYPYFRYKPYYWYQPSCKPPNNSNKDVHRGPRKIYTQPKDIHKGGGGGGRLPRQK